MLGNRLYFIGAGPGASDLITIRGAKALKKSKSVFLTDYYRDSFSESLADKELFTPFNYLFADITVLISELLEKGDVSFLVPGDLTIFSPFQSIVCHFGDDCTLIPGVSSLNAASAILKKSLDLPKVSSSIIITSPRSISKSEFTKDLAQIIRRDSTLVLFMNNLPTETLREELLKEYPPETPVAVIHKISMPGEKTIITTIDELEVDVDDTEYFNIGRLEPCMSLIIVGDVIKTSGRKEFWDFRKINIWDNRKRDA